MKRERFWTKSYGQEIKDVDPKLFETSTVDLYRQTIAKNAKIPAYIFMGVPFTFAEFDRLTNQFANMLIANGLKKGDVVGINLPNVPAYPIAWLGTLKAGCVVTGISPLLSTDEMEHQLRDSEAKALVTLDVLFAFRVVGIAPKLPKLKVVVAGSVVDFLPKIKQFLAKKLKKVPTGPVTPLAGKTVYTVMDVLKKGAFPDTDPAVKTGPDDTAMLMYTGGTTGVPKGAILTHRNNVAEILVTTRYMQWDTVQDRVLSAFPMFHIAGMAFNEISLYNGWTQILLPDPRNTDYICDMLKKYKPFLIANVPSLYHMLMANPRFKTLDHSNLQQCISAAAPFPVESQKELESTIGKNKLIELYGMTETTAVCVMNPLKGQHKLGTIGLPLPNTDIKLVEPGTGNDVDLGQPGEFCIKCPNLMGAYYKKPEETRLAFDGEGYFHTGDVMVQDKDGYLTIVDRTKDMIIVSGFKVFSKKVEDILAKHPAVEMIATIGLPDPKRPGSELVKAYMTVVSGYDYGGDEDRLKAEVLALAKDKLAPYEVPKEIEIRKELPLTSVGKLDKKQLRKNP
ncbi:MAG: AMP-binding protein [Deltaproteobacteria bacterium]|nr:AMP-binding protein [Candidatus Zymogenaceae bacterium]